MQTHWFYTVWPFIGLGGAIVMVAILLATDTFRGNTTVSRWRDPVWLGWLAAPLYWVHQFEEYSLPVLGFDYSIQEMICEKNRLSAVSGLSDSAGLLPGGEHRSHVVWGAASGIPRQAQRPHRPQLLGIALRQRTCAHRGGRRAGRLQHRPMEQPPSCLFRCPSGSFTPARFADRIAARSWAWRSPPEPSLMSCFSWATGFTRPG